MNKQSSQWDSQQPTQLEMAKTYRFMMVYGILLPTIYTLFGKMMGAPGKIRDPMAGSSKTRPNAVGFEGLILWSAGPSN